MEDPPSIITTPWSRRTGWVYHLRGQDTRQLAGLANLPRVEEAHLSRVCAALETMLPRLHDGAQIQHCPISVLRIISSLPPQRLRREKWIVVGRGRGDGPFQGSGNRISPGAWASSTACETPCPELVGRACVASPTRTTEPVFVLVDLDQVGRGGVI